MHGQSCEFSFQDSRLNLETGIAAEPWSCGRLSR